jgi:lipoprotein-anchoring transpeptidase ErfK/SrfK
MRFFYGHLPAAIPALAAIVLASLAILHAAPQEMQVQKPKPRQKPAKELINKQAKPQTVPRVLEKANPSNTRIYISLSKQRAYLLVGDEVAIDTPISSGKRAGMTPKGNYTVLEKDADHRSNIYGSFVNKRGEVVRSGVSTRIDSAPSGTHYVGAPMKWFMRLSWQGVGMHVGILPGYPASHGCVRMPDDIAKMFYDRVKIGTPAVIGD